MNGDQALKTGLNDPRALDILTTEHWSLLSTSAIVIALALLAQATHFGAKRCGSLC